MNDLKQCLAKAVEQEITKADKNVTKETAQIRVLKKVFILLEKDKKDVRSVILDDPDTVFVNPQVSAYLSKLLPVNLFDDPLEKDFVRKMYSGDYHEANEVDAYCDLMDRKIKDPVLRHGLNYAFAFDGFRGENLKAYKSSLLRALKEVGYEEGGDDWEEREIRNGNRLRESKEENEERLETIHVRSVRDMYRKFDKIRSELVHIAIQNALDSTQSSEHRVNMLTERYVQSTGSVLQKIKEMIESKYVCYVDDVATE